MSLSSGIDSESNSQCEESDDEEEDKRKKEKFSK